jgi:hypothetical protein
VAHLSPLQRQAALWQDEQRADGFLLGGEALEEAEDWAKVNRDRLTEVEREFLDECKEAQRLHEARRRRIQLVLLAAMLLVAFAVLFRTSLVNKQNVEKASSSFWDAENARATVNAVSGTAVAAQRAEVTALAAAKEGLSVASTGVARSQALAGTIEALEVTNEALAAQLTPTTTPPGVPQTPSATPTPAANWTATAAAVTAQAIETQSAQVGATQMAMVKATQTSAAQATQTAMAVEATQTAMAEARYCYVGELTRRENIGPPAISIWGRVLDRNGRGVPGVLVRIVNDWGWSHELRTRPQGWFRVDGLTEPIVWTVRLPDYGASVKVPITDYGQKAIVTFAEGRCP